MADQDWDAIPDWSAISDEQWRERLSSEAYRVCRGRGTERAFSGALYHEARSGSYRCTCCDVELFNSAAKYDSGSGWPSFYDAAGAIRSVPDDSHQMRRTEIVCARCDSHLGHVFPDGPRPTGLRYCVNSISLRFLPTDE